jgi:hypothetical protein
MAIALTALAAFSVSDSWTTELRAQLRAIVCNETYQWRTMGYFCSKNRVFKAGSPELTAAVCLEALYGIFPSNQK